VGKGKENVIPFRKKITVARREADQAERPRKNALQRGRNRQKTLLLNKRLKLAEYRFTWCSLPKPKNKKKKNPPNQTPQNQKKNTKKKKHTKKTKKKPPPNTKTNQKTKKPTPGQLTCTGIHETYRKQ